MAEETGETALPDVTKGGWKTFALKHPFVFRGGERREIKASGFGDGQDWGVKTVSDHFAGGLATHIEAEPKT